ncbi:hypothetical protein MOUN0_L01662 [Monosporozyma unispora]
MGGLRDDNFEELVPMVDSVFKIMNPDLEKPIDCRRVLELLNEIFCLDLDRERGVMYKFIRFRWGQFKLHRIVKIERKHMDMREQNFLRNLKGIYIDEKDGAEIVLENTPTGNSNDAGEIPEGDGTGTSSELVVPPHLTSVKINKMDKDKLKRLQQLASKESSRAKRYVHKGLIKGSEKNIRFNKVIYKTNELIYNITGMKQGTRFEIVRAIRGYIEEHNLKSKDPSSPDQFDCDEKLTPVFGNYFTMSRLRKISAERLLKYRNGSSHSNIAVVTIKQDNVNEDNSTTTLENKGDQEIAKDDKKSNFEIKIKP